ncbi:unnamed protein product [Linum trigynum]|uniref:Uncharacterized protein n=1 Tax=Linum trigynum TaxID=586398 RepID=A0AAV2FCS2_9ROSI
MTSSSTTKFIISPSFFSGIANFTSIDSPRTRCLYTSSPTPPPHPLSSESISSTSASATSATLSPLPTTSRRLPLRPPQWHWLRETGGRQIGPPS